MKSYMPGSGNMKRKVMGRGWLGAIVASALIAGAGMAGADAPKQPPAKKTSPATQAAIAATLNEEGKALMYEQKFAEASAKFREAAARVPDPRYFLNLGLSLFQEGKFSEALTATRAVMTNGGTGDVREKAEKLIQKIKDEAKAQGVKVD